MEEDIRCHYDNKRHDNICAIDQNTVNQVIAFYTQKGEDGILNQKQQGQSQEK